MKSKPSKIYEGTFVQILPSVVLDIPAPKGHCHHLKIGQPQQILIHTRDMFCDGDWNILIEWIRKSGSFEKQEDVTYCAILQKFEKKYKVDLGSILRERLPLIPTN